MPTKRYVVHLSSDERRHLEKLISSGVEWARTITHARILLKANDGWTDHEISRALDVSVPTIKRVRKRYVRRGLERALRRKLPQPDPPHKLEELDEALLLALAESRPPAGHSRWTLRLLAEHLIQLDDVRVDSISHETIRKVLKQHEYELREYE